MLGTIRLWRIDKDNAGIVERLRSRGFVRIGKWRPQRHAAWQNGGAIRRRPSTKYLQLRIILFALHSLQPIVKRRISENAARKMIINDSTAEHHLWCRPVNAMSFIISRMAQLFQSRSHSEQMGYWLPLPRIGVFVRLSFFIYYFIRNYGKNWIVPCFVWGEKWWL